ncbi:hypothetical protein [Solibacillus sp. CAU 1738]|uniref:hypothetical protein n=1 Tax=Solibacillus sp. CAU 1738 TaxID=3140363 RepID=UPI00325FE418
MKYKRLKFASLLFIGPLFLSSTYILASVLGDIDNINMIDEVDNDRASEQNALTKQIQPAIIPAFTTQKGTVKQNIDE